MITLDNYNRILFTTSVLTCILFWTVFGTPNLEPWEGPNEWIILCLMGLCFGFIGKRLPWLWGLGIYVGEVIYILVDNTFFYEGIGANMFVPAGMILLLIYTTPAFIGTYVGYGLKRLINRASNKNE